MNVGNIQSTQKAAAAQKVHNSTFGAMQKRFSGQAGAFAYLLFVLLYFPCVATIGAIRREAGTPWALFVAAWTTSIAYVTATSYYQISTFSQHPVFSGFWLGGVVLLIASLIIGLRRWAHQKEEQIDTAEVTV